MHFFSLNAQITATLKHLPNGGDEVTVRNDFAIAATAFGITVKQVPRSDYNTRAPLVFYSDPLIDPANKPLPPKQERVVMGYAESPRPSRPSASIEHILEGPVAVAGVLADGTSTGDAALLTRLILRRSNMLLAVETSIETLTDAGRRNIPRVQLIEQFQKMSDSMNRWYLPAEQQVGRGVYQSIMGKLLNLTVGDAGAAFPPAVFIAQETAALNRQRVNLLESQPSLEDAVLVSAR